MAPILFDILAPILIMVGLGSLLRWKFKLDLGTLSKLNIYLFVPAFIFHHVSNSTLLWSEMAGIVAICVIQVATLGILIWWMGHALAVQRKTLAAVAMAIMFYNSGNYGLPLAELAYQNRGSQVQAFVMLSQNVLTYTLGLAIAASAHSGGIGKGFATLFRMPVLPTLAAALAARWYLRADPTHHLPQFISETARYLSAGLVPIALVTLGAQLAINPRWPRWRPISFVLIMRLLFGPAQMIALLYGLHLAARHWGGFWMKMDLWPWPAELLILTAAVPTAVTTLLLTLELDGDAELAADCIFWTTVFSCLSITAWLFGIRWFFNGL